MDIHTLQAEKGKLFRKPDTTPTIEQWMKVNMVIVTMIKHAIPSEEAEQIHLGDGTVTISTRIWLNNKPLQLHNIYRVDGELDITTPLTQEQRSIMVVDFNARDEMWC